MKFEFLLQLKLKPATVRVRKRCSLGPADDGDGCHLSIGEDFVPTKGSGA